MKMLNDLARFVFLFMAVGAMGVFFAGAAHAQINVPAIERDLAVGLKGADVLSLQQFLNASGFTIAKGGPGSVGHETLLFGNATKAALAKFQEYRPPAILAPKPGRIWFQSPKLT